MTAPRRKSPNPQAGFTLVELIIASALGLFVATALTSVVFTSVNAANIAIGRLEASSEIRNFQLRAYSDFASSGMPAINGCGAQASNPCHTDPIVLTTVQVSNTDPPTPSDVTITYRWDGSASLDRQAGTAKTQLAANVTAFSWYLEPATQTVVVQMTVSVLSYSESQTLQFHPRLSG